MASTIINDGYVLPLLSANLMQKCDVSGESDVLTLGGYNLGVTAESELETTIHKSIEAAIKLSWRLNKFNLYAYASRSAVPPSVSVNVLENDYSDLTPATKKVSSAHSFFYQSGGTANVEISTGVNLIYRFYNGSTNNENNFIGYGIYSNTSSHGLINVIAATFSLASAGVRLNSWETNLAGGPSGINRDTAHVEIGGIHLRCEAFASGGGSPPDSRLVTRLVVASDLHADCTWDDGSESFETAIDLKDNSGPFEFYNEIT